MSQVCVCVSLSLSLTTHIIARSAYKSLSYMYISYIYKYIRSYLYISTRSECIYIGGLSLCMYVCISDIYIHAEYKCKSKGQTVNDRPPTNTQICTKHMLNRYANIPKTNILQKKKNQTCQCHRLTAPPLLAI
jgi:hypothetical protein